MRKTRKREGPRKAIFHEGGFGPDIDSPADDLVSEAWDAETAAQRVKLARKAIDVDLDALDAYNILGIHAATHGERIALFREAVRIGDRLFATVIAQSAGDEEGLWGFLGMRPWMRAQHNLGLALVQAGDRPEAIDVFKRLKGFNPGDNQGIRMLLLQMAAEDGDYGTCKVLFADYPDDWSIEFIATRLLVDIATRRKIDFAAHVAAIDECNAHVLPALAIAARGGAWPRPPKSDFVAAGSKEAAAIYLDAFKAAWTRQPKLLETFLQAHEARTPENRA
ncbi:hypothetical protein [Ensifer soli]|uniref:hypothetical protein n=1 Tax=Ciceribacter sp. sgz301302 TaxID=3342379 RepID=UPI0035B9A419